MVKNPSASAGAMGDTGSIHGSGRSLVIGNGNPLQYSCLENPTEGTGGLQSMDLQRVRCDLANEREHTGIDREVERESVWVYGCV